MTTWYYAKDGQQRGPVTADELHERHQQGELTATDLVWREGWPQWQPLAEAISELGLPSDRPLPPSLPPLPVDSVAERAGPAPGAIVIYAGFWRRWAALFLDNLILMTVFYGVVFAIMLVWGLTAGLSSLTSDQPPSWLSGGFLLLVVLFYPLAALYYGLQESGRHQATFGKRALGIKVCDSQGRRLSLGHALGRWAAAALSYLTLYVGFVMAAFTERKQALHDLVAGTLVTDRWAYSDHPERQQQGISGCLVAVIVAAVGLGAVAVLGILAAIAIPAYQDYTVRAQVSEVIHRASPAKLALAEFVANTDRCPHDWQELGVLAPTGPALRSADIGEYDDGRCVIELTLAAIKGYADSAGQRIWLTREADGGWRCDGEVKAKFMPSACR